MKILVIGGAGYIGSHVAHAFVDRGDEVAVLDNFSSGSRINLPNNTEIFEGDILDRSFLHKVFSLGWNGIVHLAAFKAAGESMEKPGQYAVNNICGTINILNAMVESRFPAALVFSSSAAVFGEPIHLPIDEDHPKEPTNFYGFTKLEIEKLLDWYARLAGICSASLRYFNAAGYDIAGRVTEPEHNPQNLLPILMEAVVGIRKSVTIYGNDYDTPDGTCIRDYVHVSDLADAHVNAMEHIIRNTTSIKVNLGSQSGISVTEMINAVIQVTGIEFPYSIGPRREGDPAKLIASSKRAMEVLKWSALRSSPESLISSTWKVYESLR